MVYEPFCGSRAAQTLRFHLERPEYAPIQHVYTLDPLSPALDPALSRRCLYRHPAKSSSSLEGNHQRELKMQVTGPLLGESEAAVRPQQSAYVEPSGTHSIHAGGSLTLGPPADQGVTVLALKNSLHPDFFYGKENN